MHGRRNPSFLPTYDLTFVTSATIISALDGSKSAFVYRFVTNHLKCMCYFTRLENTLNEIFCRRSFQNFSLLLLLSSFSAWLEIRHSPSPHHEHSAVCLTRISFICQKFTSAFKTRKGRFSPCVTVFLNNLL